MSIEKSDTLLKNEIVYISVFFFVNIILKLKVGDLTGVERLVECCRRKCHNT